MTVARRPGTVFLSATLLWFVCAAYYTSDAALDMAPLMSLVGGAALLAGVAIVRAVLARRQQAAPPLSRRDLLAWAAFPAALVIVMLSFWSGAGLRLRLALSAEALRTYPATAPPDSHESFRSPPVRVGLFWVSEVQAVGLCRRFVTTRVFLDDAGLVFCPVGEPPRVGEDSYRPLGNGFWVWHRSF